MKTDIEIAQETKLIPINELAHSAGLADSEFEPYGRDKAKVTLDPSRQEKGRLILVTATSGMPAGSGKTTTSIALAQGLKRLGKNAALALREPSLGPVFGMKGGAAGGGYSQVLPMEAINLHFTGDLHAITAANNLLAALLDNARHQGQVQLREIYWRRVLDVNDRMLRNIITGLGGPANGIPTEAGFDITAASELMAVLCLANDLEDLRSRIDRILREHDMDPEGKYIGFVLRKWPGIEEKATVFAAGAVYAYLKYGLTPVFLSINFRTDGEASQLVTEHLSIPFYTLDEQMSTGEVIGVLSRMTAVVSMRLHGLIFAAGQGVPLIGVAYDPKVTAFLDYVEQNNYMQFEAVNEKDLSDRIDAAVALAGRGEEMRRRTELLNRQEDNNRATAARLLGKE